MSGHIILLAMVMLVAGIFGGLVNFQIGLQRDPENTDLTRCLVIGIGAAFLVPLILHVVSNDLVIASSDEPSKLLIFTGFCLIAAVGSRLLMNPLSERTLSEARLASKRAQDVERELVAVQSELFPLIETETEDEPTDDGTVLFEEENELLDLTSSTVLKTLDSGDHIFRSLKGICVDTNTDEATVARTLAVLMSKSYVGRTLSPKGIRWYITEKGRKALRNPY